MHADGRAVRIYYRRPPDRVQLYEQTLVSDAQGALISLQETTPIERPMEIGHQRVLEPGSPVVWFTFADTWHDIGRFHDASGQFTGWYANILTPVRLHAPDAEVCEWHTTDLFLDVWLGVDGALELLDIDELEAAVSHEWVDQVTAARAHDEAQRLIELARNDEWPPALAREWTLERVRAAMSSSDLNDDQSLSAPSR
jgi:predicted RNA-binding protein associated with RNAse of E/G family